VTTVRPLVILLIDVLVRCRLNQLSRWLELLADGELLARQVDLTTVCTHNSLGASVNSENKGGGISS